MNITYQTRIKNYLGQKLRIQVLIFFVVFSYSKAFSSLGYPFPKGNQENAIVQLPNKEIALLLLKKYEQKDLTSIAEMFDENVIIRDWKIRVTGKDKALSEFQKNFDAVKSLKIEVLELYENKNTVAAELRIVIDDKQEIFIIDVITITDKGKIESIRSYIGRGDKE